MRRGLCIWGTVLLVQGCSLDFDFETADPTKHKDGGAADGGGGPANGDGGPADGDGSTPDDNGSDAGADASVDTPPQTTCTTDEDCVDTDRYACVSHRCEEYACHTTRPCKSGLCDDHTCIDFVPPERIPSGYTQTSGGGVVRSGKYSMRFSVGTPQPFGRATGKHHRLTLGPGATTP